MPTSKDEIKAIKPIGLSVLTGLDKSSDEYKNTFKTMCLNCTQCTNNGEGFNCFNGAVIESYKKKILSTMPDDVEVSSFELSSIKLKDPTKKCKNHVLNMEAVVNEIKEFFTPATNEKGE